jgi:hypothetical protein
MEGVGYLELSGSNTIYISAIYLIEIQNTGKTYDMLFV